MDSAGAAVGPYVPADVSAFYNETLPASEPHARVMGVPLNGAAPPGPSASYDTTGANFENTLDLQMVGSTAPGASVYNVYGPSPSSANLDAAFSYVLNPTNTPGLANVSVITNSWGAPDYNDTNWFQDLQEAQARGVSVLAATGDSGDNPLSPKYEGGPDYTEFPSAMAYRTFGVTAVGGTTVKLNPTPSSAVYLHLIAQTAWYDATVPDGSTGGVSTVFPEPSWQLSTSANAVIQGQGRGTPDIAAIANSTLVTITIDGIQYQASDATYGGEFYYASGTSVASPLEAGIVAEIDHVLAAHGDSALGFLNPQLYELANMEFAPLTSTATTGYDVTGSFVSPLPTLPLLDVTTGGNSVYVALPGYDLATGWGSIDGYNYTMYFLAVTSAGVYGRLSGVEDDFTLNGLAVTSFYPNGTVNTDYNASIQQNFFLANSLGAPVYWVQNVIYVSHQNGKWAMWYTGWVVFPFYGLYPDLTIYEYNFPSGQYVSLPSTFDVETVLETPAGFNTQYVAFSVGTSTVTLPVPGAAYIIGSLTYTYSWQGANYTNGPFPNNPTPGGLAPQFGLVGGPSAATGRFQRPTSGSLSATVLPYGASGFAPAATASFGENIDETGESSANLGWSETSSSQWTLAIASGSVTQGILSYESTAATYPVTFSESGLPSGTSWSVTVNGATESSTSSTITFIEPNGTYAYSIGDVAGWHQTTLPYTGSVMVNGVAVREPTLAFAQVTYTVTFAETNLPDGTPWSVTLNGSTEGSTITSIVFTGMVNGSYSYTVGTVSGYASSPSSGAVMVDGGSLTQAIAFTAVYTVTITETGLLSGTVWTATILASGVPVAGPATEETTTITFSNLPNGAYTYSITPIKGYSTHYNGQVTVNGGPTSVSVAFTPVTYAVTFSETGLTGETWGISSFAVPPLTYTSTTDSITIQSPNGTYSFRVLPVAGWKTTVYIATFTEQGGVQNPSPVTVAFTQVTYTVTFTAGGLTNEQWGITFNGTTSARTLAANSITFQSPNGTYNYNVSNVAGLRANVYSGTVTVSGANPGTVTVTFAQATYSVTFAETGLRPGTGWYVNLTGGSSFSSTTTTIAFGEPNGTYPFAVETEANYVATSSSGMLIVAGASLDEAITFAETFGITFDRPSGTPAGASWTVYVNTTALSAVSWLGEAAPSGIVRTTTESTLVVLVPNGTYDYSIVVPGNPALTTQGAVTMDGLPVVANPPPAPSTFLGFSGLTGYYILAASVIAGLAIGVVVVVLRRRRPPPVTASPPGTIPPSPPSLGGNTAGDTPPPATGLGYGAPISSPVSAGSSAYEPAGKGGGNPPAPPLSRFCGNCGGTISRDARFCPHCGHPLGP